MFLMGTITISVMETYSYLTFLECNDSCRKSGFVVGDNKTSGCMCLSKEYMNSYNKSEIKSRSIE